MESLELKSDHRLMKDCEEQFGWKNAGTSCPRREWTPKVQIPVSHTMDEKVALRLRFAPGAPVTAAIRGEGPSEMAFLARRKALPPGATWLDLDSDRALERKIQKLDFTVRWSSPGENDVVVPAETSSLLYVTMGRPLIDHQDEWPEDGVTRKRMDRAMAWVEPLGTLDPHAIVSALMEKFPFYSLHPSPKVPPQFKHPGYHNDEGGAWAMTDYVEESGECQAIVRLLRAILRQLGVPADVQIMVTWAEPELDGTWTVHHANIEESPGAGLSIIRMIEGKRAVAVLIDRAVEEGQSYPASHTPMADGKLSPGLNRFEACLKLTADGTTRYYCGGAGVIDEEAKIISTFWGLVWVTPTTDNGYRIEKIVTKF
jgi:hypothetical protein